MQNLQILGFGNSRYDYDTFFHSEDASKIEKLPIQKISFPLVNVEYLICDSRFEVGRLRFVSIPIKFVSFLCQESIDSKSDLIPGEYGGGYKVWECTRDLVEYLHSCSFYNSTKGRVLELGCGIGLPGIAALCLGISHDCAYFCDFNRSVLVETTWPSICANVHHRLKMGEELKSKFVKCFSGDWMQVSKLFQRFVILSLALIYYVSFPINLYFKL